MEETDIADDTHSKISPASISSEEKNSFGNNGSDDAVHESTQITEKSTFEETQTNSVVRSLPKVHIPIIEDTIDFVNHKDYLDRFFTMRYCIDVNQKCNDFCVLVHSNKVCVITLAPSHPLIRNNIEVKKINFQVSKNINRLNNKISGKHKRHAQNLNQTSPLCYVECAGDKIYTIYSVVPGKLLEMNDILENNPQKIQECCPKFYHKRCYVAIVLPSIHHTTESLNKNFLTPEEYDRAMKERESCENVECL